MVKRDKLSEQQKRQVKKQQRERMENKNALSQSFEQLSESKKGLVISRYGEQADIFDLAKRKTYRCYLRQNLGTLVSGDQVNFRIAENDQGVVESVMERRSVLQRPSQYQDLKPIVANIDQVFVVVAPLPDFSSILLDRYLIAIQDADIKVNILLNKSELSNEIEQQSLNSQLSIYQALGYFCLKISVKKGTGMDTLKKMAKDHKSILVGQSGVGKSSIINSLFPEQDSRVKTVSDNSRLGQHTTTWSQLFLFENDTGFIIDSPGIREFGLWHLGKTEIAQGFIEFQPYLGLCKFRDCQHVSEPDCALLAAVEQQKIHPQRWQNYQKILESLDT